jgi:hypothetical protein
MEGEGGQPRPRAASTPHFNGGGSSVLHHNSRQTNGHQRTTSSGSSNSLSGSGTSIMVPVLPSSFYAYIKRNIPASSLRYNNHHIMSEISSISFISLL